MPGAAPRSHGDAGRLKEKIPDAGFFDLTPLVDG